MSDLNISKEKKYEWLAKNGPANALQLLGLQVDTFSKQANDNRLVFKETKEVNDALDTISFDAQEAVEEEGTQVLVEPTEEATEIKEISEEPTTTEFSELVDALTENLITPIADVLAEVTKALSEQRQEIETLRKELDAIRNDVVVKEAQDLNEQLPTASVAALVKQRIELIMNSDRFGAPVSNEEPLLKQRPAENLVKQEKDNPFASFLNGA